MSMFPPAARVAPNVWPPTGGGYICAVVHGAGTSVAATVRLPSTPPPTSVAPVTLSFRVTSRARTGSSTIATVRWVPGRSWRRLRVIPSRSRFRDRQVVFPPTGRPRSTELLTVATHFIQGQRIAVTAAAVGSLSQPTNCSREHSSPHRRARPAPWDGHDQSHRGVTPRPTVGGGGSTSSQPRTAGQPPRSRAAPDPFSATSARHAPSIVEGPSSHLLVEGTLCRHRPGEA